MREVEAVLISNPEAGDVEAGTGGVRKLRAAIGGRGKRGGARIMYLFVRVRDRIYFIAAYAKNVQESLTDDEKKIIRSLVDDLKKERG